MFEKIRFLISLELAVHTLWTSYLMKSSDLPTYLHVNYRIIIISFCELIRFISLLCSTNFGIWNHQNCLLIHDILTNLPCELQIRLVNSSDFALYVIIKDIKKDSVFNIIKIAKSHPMSFISKAYEIIRFTFLSNIF